MALTDTEKAAKARNEALKGALTQIEREFGKGTVMRMGDPGAQGKVNIAADNGKNYTLNFSLKGFSQAHDDMVAQARAKAKPVEQQAAAPAATP